MSTTPIITNATSTTVADPTGGAALWSVATISTSTITDPTTNVSSNVESAFFYLRGATPTSYGGAIQADYTVAANGTLTPVDQIFYQANLGIVATYFGSEAANPLLAAGGATTADPGFSYTQYVYAPGGALSQVVAYDASTGKTYVGI